MTATLPPAKSVAKWVPIGFRGFGFPGSGGVYDSTNNSINDMMLFNAPSFASVRAIRLVYSGFDITSNGPTDRTTTVTGYASVYVPGNAFIAYTAAQVASGATTMTLSLGSGLVGNSVSPGMTAAATGIPAGTYITAVAPAYNAGGTMTGYTVTLSAATTGIIAQTTAVSFSGKFYPAKFAGKRQVTIEPSHDLIVSDPIALSVAAGGQFFVKGSWTFSATGLLIAATPSPVSGSTRLSFSGINESSNRGTGLADLTAVPTQPVNSGAGWWAPVMVLALLNVSYPLTSVQVSGDSIAAGTGDAADANGRMGYINRSLGSSVPWLTTARGSTTASQSANAWRGLFRAAVEANATDLILEHCRNDIWGGTTAVQTKAAVASVAAPFLAAGIRVWVCTCPPSTTSTDAFVTAANQTIANSTYETERLSYNSDIRANYASYGYSGVVDIASVVEDSGNPGKWKTAGGAWTADGVHPNPLGHNSLVSAGVVPVNRFSG